MLDDPSSLTVPGFDTEALRPFCAEIVVPAGEMLRRKGRLALDMYLLTEGEVEVRLASGGVARAGRGSPIGEIGFLTGVPATADVVTLTTVKALYVDNAVWRALEAQAPARAVQLYRELAQVAEGRQSHNLVFDAQGSSAGERTSTLEVLLCQKPEQLLEAQRIRYQIYCGELGRSSPHADPVQGTIADDLDQTGHVLLAIEDGVPAATLRFNISRHGGLGVLEDLYGMPQSPHHPAATAVCTKFIVKKSSRLGQASFKLMATAVDLAERYAVKECFIDCIPTLKPFYGTLGFEVAGPEFLHRENGRSLPMRLDIPKYAKRISRLAGFALR